MKFTANTLALQKQLCLAGEEGGTISQDEIDALLGGTPAENTKD